MGFEPYLDQNYEHLKQNCLEKNVLFKDASFPANQSSYYKINPLKIEKVKWKRPHEFVENPQFIVNGIEPNDLDQGEIGDW